MQGDTPQVVVNGVAEARDIFIKQGAHTQNRPASRFQLLMRDGYFPSAMNGPKWRNARKMWQVILNPTAAKKYIPYQELESEQLLVDILDNPLNWRDHIDRFTNSLGMMMVNGYRITTSRDPIVKETLEDLYDMSRLGFRGKLLDFWPFLWKLPVELLPICREARKLARKHRDYIWTNYSTVKRKAELGKSLPSFNQAIQEKLKEGWEGVSEIEGAEIGQHLLSGATDTTASTLTTCIAALCLFPEVQRKAQKEIDRVVGPDRLPRVEDAENLPYVQQLILELQRWITAVPLSLPRATNGFVAWGKYGIPEETGLILNIYAIHHDPALYPEPHIFRPERWEGKLEAAHAENQLLFTFGAGRRTCPGQKLAEKSLFIVISRWLWAFNISHAKDKHGNKIPINTEDLRPGVIVRLNPFPADIKPRAPTRADLIRQVWQRNCDSLLDADYQWKTTPAEIAKLIERNGI
ncbi:hypothetical protein PRK78_007493 [Emydomyces testavorans]|uniref:Cytochrome P450 n=1 Tax=Emydomyces testavorans TaxID=2070801 RepID=A0AAF0ILQ4_9EURO|nr:hypothetical protein PRK78_007493 [Emydomyces testavorans]